MVTYALARPVVAIVPGLIEHREITVSPKVCSSCGMDINRHGLARYVEWGGLGHSFCSDFCEFFRRRTRIADLERAGAALPPQLGGGRR
jgi:hypothetical protein